MNDARLGRLNCDLRTKISTVICLPSVHTSLIAMLSRSSGPITDYSWASSACCHCPGLNMGRTLNNSQLLCGAAASMVPVECGSGAMLPTTELTSRPHDLLADFFIKQVVIFLINNDNSGRTTPL